MGSLYRGEDMVLCQMYIQADSVFHTVAELGELGVAQFRDLKSNVNMFQRQYVNEIRRCEEMERQLRVFERELKKMEMEPNELVSNPETPVLRQFVDTEAHFETLESEIRELNLSNEVLGKTYVELQELKYVLRYTDEFFDHSGREQATSEFELSRYPDGLHRVDYPDLESAGPQHQLIYIAGVIPMTRIEGFSRMLYIVSRANIFFRHYPIDEPIIDPVTGDRINKAVFLAIFQGEQLHSKLKKVAEGYRASLYPCLDSTEDRTEMTRGVNARLSELNEVMQKTTDHKIKLLDEVVKKLTIWDAQVIKLKSVFHTMNMFQNEGQNFLCEAWMPYNEIGTVQAVLERASVAAGNRVSSLCHPIEARVLPTYHKTNKFTKAFQAIIDAYGVANYKEVNPAVFSIITFPFLFSVMFGDAGHALVMLAFALFLVLNERKLAPHAEKSEIFSIIFSGRYMVLVMALFSLYSGLIYNDVFSKSINVFQSKWHVNYSIETIHTHKDLTLDPSDPAVYKRSPYEFGIDPVWQLSMNKITFTNSFKKKISVIFGVSQMLLGVILSLCNHIYFRSVLNVLCVFIPQIIFLMVIFGYLCILIFAKWLMYYDAPEFYSCSSNILIDFINMFMMQYPEPEKGCKGFMYPGQKELQTCFVILAVICALWMLLTKPFYLLFKHRRAQRGHQLLNEAENIHVDGVESGFIGDHHGDDHHGDDHHGEGDQGRELLRGNSSTPNNYDPNLDITPPPLAPISSAPVAVPPHSFTKPVQHEEPFNSGEVFIHQAIHTIEFCLGCISHTASYLRLWALSLAHAQLSEVLWSMVMHSGFVLLKMKYVGAIPIFIVFTPFAVLTVVILLLMEGLSAFLHTLRLHWVEFNSKFYIGEGMSFEPFSFRHIIRNKDK